MNKDELIQLRERLLAEITPLVVENADNGADRFSLLLRIIQSGRATKDIYTKAFESAFAIDDVGEKLDALMALLDEVEVDISRDEDDDIDDGVVHLIEQAPAEAPAEQPESEEHHDQHDGHEHHNHDQHHDQ